MFVRNKGIIELEADVDMARSVIPAASAEPRDFSFIAPEIPEFIGENCVGCMDCVTECPDTAILGKVIPRDDLDKSLGDMGKDADEFPNAIATMFLRVIEAPEFTTQIVGFSLNVILTRLGVFCSPITQISNSGK